MKRDPHSGAKSGRRSSRSSREARATREGQQARGVHVELLLGRRVVDADGQPMGRVEDVVAEVQDGEYVVRHFLVGRYALLERLGGGRLASSLLRLLGGGRGYEGYAIPWDQIDLSDPERPRARVAREELRSGVAPGELAASPST